MKKQLVIVGITLVLLIVGLSGCISSNKFIGKWVSEEEKLDTYTFYNSGIYYKQTIIY